MEKKPKKNMVFFQTEKMISKEPPTWAQATRSTYVFKRVVNGTDKAKLIKIFSKNKKPKANKAQARYVKAQESKGVGEPSEKLKPQ